MDLLQYFCMFLSLLLPLLLLINSRAHKHGQRLPPGPWRLPVIGSLHHLLSPLTHRAMADLARRHNAPVMYLKLGEVPTVIISSPAGAREVMQKHDVAFATRPWSSTTKAFMADGLGVAFAPYGGFWRQQRKLCILELLSARRVQSFRRIREDEAARLVLSIAAASSSQLVNVSQRVAVSITDSAVRTMIGGRFARRDEFLQTLGESLKITTGFNLGDLFPSSKLAGLVGGTSRAGEIHRRMFALMDCAIKQHQERRAAAAAADLDAEEGEDLLDVLLRIQNEGGLEFPLTMGTIKALIRDLFVAGSETSATTLQWAMSELMRNPGVMQKAQTELRHTFEGKTKVTEDDLAHLKYSKLVIKETLRLHPAAPLLLPRECQEPCQVLGYDVPKGTTLFVNAWAIGRDPEYWDEPEEFKPERFEDHAVDFKGMDFEFIPFGSGRRMCPGMTFALANIELILATLLFHFDWELPVGVGTSELDMSEEMGLTVRRKYDLCLHPIVRVPLHAAA